MTDMNVMMAEEFPEALENALYRYLKSNIIYKDIEEKLIKIISMDMDTEYYAILKFYNKVGNFIGKNTCGFDNKNIKNVKQKINKYIDHLSNDYKSYHMIHIDIYKRDSKLEPISYIKFVK